MSIDIGVEAFLDLSNKIKGIHRHVSRMPIRRTIHGTALSVNVGLNNYALVECTQSPPPGRAWNLRSMHIMVANGIGAGALPQSPGGSVQINSFSQGYSTTAAAAAAGSLTMTSSSMAQSWRVDPAAAWPAGTNQVTITQLQGGTQTYDLPGGTTNSLIVNYGNPGMQAPFGTPVISVPAIVGGPAYSINAVGTILGNSNLNTAADVYIGLAGDAKAPYAGVDLAGIVESDLGPMPYHETFTSGVYWIHPGERLYMVVGQIPGANLECTLVARIDDWPYEKALATEA